MPRYELTGTVKTIFEQRTFPSGFTKREFVVTTEERYPQDIKLECVKDWCALLDGVHPGDRVKVQFRLRGNEYNERFYVNLQAFGLEAIPEDGERGEAAETEAPTYFGGEDIEPEDGPVF